jgi:hypothetical protein
MSLKMSLMVSYPQYIKEIQTLSGIATGIQITILNIIYERVAIAFTNYENHKTQTNFERSLIGKTLYSFNYSQNNYLACFNLSTAIIPLCI